MPFAMLRASGHASRAARVTAALVTGNFFQVLGVQAALGRPLTPDDDERFAGRPVIVLSHSGWNKLFAGDPTVIGRSVRDQRRCRTRSSASCPRAFAASASARPTTGRRSRSPGSSATTYAGSEDEIPIDVVGRLKPGMSPEAATAGLTVWASGRTDLDSASGEPSSHPSR